MVEFVKKLPESGQFAKRSDGICIETARIWPGSGHLPKDLVEFVQKLLESGHCIYLIEFGDEFGIAFALLAEQVELLLFVTGMTQGEIIKWNTRITLIKQRIVHEIFCLSDEYLMTSFLLTLIGQFGQIPPKKSKQKFIGP